MPIFYIPTSILVQQVPNGVHKRTILILACLMSFFANLFVGPSELFNFPDSIWTCIIGQALRGMIDPFTLVPALPEMIESVALHYPQSAEFQINNLSSGMFNMFLGLGQIFGPMYGATIADAYGFRTCCDSVAVICLTYAVLYYIFANGKHAFINSSWRHYTPLNDENTSVQYVDGLKTPASHLRSFNS
jgi:MFS family permease